MASVKVRALLSRSFYIVQECPALWHVHGPAASPWPGPFNCICVHITHQFGGRRKKQRREKERRHSSVR